MPKKNPSNFNVDSVRVVKILGGSIFDTSVVKGMVFGREHLKAFILLNCSNCVVILKLFWILLFEFKNVTFC